MIEDLLVLACGLVAIFLGGRWLIGGASQLAASVGVRPFVIGLTIIGFGTSAPELALGVLANAEQAGSVSLGNVIGSNVNNMTYILGASAMIFPLAVKFDLIRREGAVALGSVLLLVILVIGGDLTWWEGALMLLAFAIYLLVLLKTLRRCDPSSDVTCQFEDLGEDRWGTRKSLGILLIGLVLLVLGAQATVSGAVEIATDLGVEEVLIGVTIVSLGTTLPELTICIFSALKKRPDLAMGNALGTITFNTLVVLGVGALVSGGIPVPPNVLYIGMLPMVGLVLLPILAIQLKGRISKRLGIVLIALYLIYLGALLGLS